MEINPEDLDPREQTISGRCLLLETIRRKEKLMMLENMSLEERYKKKIRLSSSLPRSRDSSLTRESEERRSTRTKSWLLTNSLKLKELSMKKYFLSLLKKGRLFTTRKKK